MSNQVDQRVVSMVFDNSNFKRNCSETMSLLDQLKGKLSFKDVKNTFGDLADSANSVSFNGLYNSIDAVSDKISLLRIAAGNALGDLITDLRVKSTELVKSLSTDQIFAGYNKYEEKTANVQTLVNSTGKSIEEVNNYLSELMWFSDETSYSFTQMTGALAQMTSAGGDVEELIPLITGIANATAFAGKGAREFSSAIYNLNQSYSKGYLDYSDWKSIDLMGVSSKQLKQTIIEVGEELGKIDKGSVDISTFASTLKSKWADQEVMIKAFGRFSKFSEAVKKSVQNGEYETASDAIAAMSGNFDELSVKAFTAAQEAKTFQEAIDATKDAVSSGWASTFELLFGNYDEAKVLWTDLANELWDIFAAGAESRNNWLSSVLTGDNNSLNFFSSFAENAEELRDEYGSLWEAFKQGEININNISLSLKNLGASSEKYLTVSEKSWTNIEKKLQDAKISMEDFNNAAKDVAKENGYNVDALLASYGDGWKALFETGEVRVSVLRAALARLGVDSSDVFEITKNDFNTLIETTKKGIEPIEKWEESVKAFSKNAGYDIDQLLDKTKKSTIEIDGVVKNLNNEYETASGEIATMSNQYSSWFSLVSSGVLPLTVLRNSIKDLGIDTDKYITVSENSWSNMITGINEAGFSLDKLNKKVKQVAESYGFDVSEFPSTYEMFDAFQNGTYSIDVLLEALSELGIDGSKYLDLTASNWVQLKKIMEEGIEVPESSDSMTGRELLVNSFITSLEHLKSLMEVVKEAWSDVFPSVSSSIIYNIVKGLHDFIESLEITDERSEKLKSVFSGLFYALSIGKSILSTVLTILSPFTDLLKSLFDTSVEGTISIGKSIQTLDTRLKNFLNNNQDKIQKAQQVVKTVCDDIGNVVSVTAKLITSLISKFANTGVSEAANGFIKALSFVGNTAVKVFTTVSDAFTVLKDRIFNRGTTDEVEKTSEKVQQAGDNLTKTIDVASKAFTKFKPVIDAVKDSLGKGLSVALEKLDNFLDTITFDSVVNAIAKLTAVGVGTGGLIYGLTSIIGLVKKLKELVSSVKDGSIVSNFVNSLFGNNPVVNTVSQGIGVLDKAVISIRDFLKGLGKEAALKGYAEVVKQLGIALLEMAAALWILSTIPKGSLLGPLAALNSTLVVLAVLSGYLSKITIQKGEKASTVALMQLIRALVVVALTFKMLSSMSWPDILRASVGMIAVLVTIGILIGEMKLIDMLLKGSDVTGVAGNLLLMALSLIPIALSLKLLSTIQWEDMKTALIGLGAVLGAFAGITFVLSVIQGLSDGKGLVGIAETITAFAVSLLIIAGVLKLLSTIDPDDMTSALTGIVVTLTAILLVLLTLDLVTGGSGEGLVLIASALLIISAAIGILALSLKMLAEVDPAKLGVALGILVVGMLAFVGILYLLSTVAPVLGIIALVFVSIAAAMVGFAMAVTAVSAAVMVIVTAIMLLAGAGTAAAVVIAASFRIIFTAIIDTLLSLGDKIRELVTGLITTFCQALYENVGTIVTTVLSIIVLLLDKLIEFAPVVLDKLITLIVSLVNVLSSRVGEVLDALFGFIQALLTGLVDALEAHLPTISEDFVRLFTVIVQNALTIFTGVFGVLAEGLGTVIGKLVEGVLKGVAKGLAPMGESLSGFMEAAKPFFDGLKDITPDQAKAAKTLAEMMLIFCGAEIVNGLANVVSFFTGGSSLESFGKELAAFAPYMATFAKETKDINGSKVKSAAQAAVELAKFAKQIPNEGGLVAKITGDNSLDKFGQELASFAPHLAVFYGFVKGISNWQPVYDATDAASYLVAFAKTIPNEGGFVAALTGDNSLAMFAKEMADFGLNLKTFLGNINGITDEDVHKAELAAGVGEKLTTFAKTISNEGGFVAAVTGDNSLGMFAEEMAAFGTNLSDFVENVKGLDNSGVSTAKNAVSIATDIASISALNLNKKNLETFSDGMIKFGQSLKKFCEDLADLKSVDEIKNSANKLISDFVSVFSGEDNRLKFQNIGTDIITRILLGFVVSYEDYKEGCNKLPQGIIDTFTEKNKDFISTASEAVNKLISGLESRIAALKVTGRALAIGVCSAFKDKYSEFYAAGRYATEGLKDGLSDSSAVSALYAEADRIASNVAAKMRAALDEHSPSRITRQVGRFATEGLALGLIDEESRVETASEEVANTAKSGLAKAIEAVSDFIQNGIDSTPTITPVLDLSNVEAGAQTISAMFSRNQALSVGNVGKYANEYDAEDPTNSNKSGASINYVQNNYSPKALSRSEIYRQTKNQLSAMKGVPV